MLEFVRYTNFVIIIIIIHWHNEVWRSEQVTQEVSQMWRDNRCNTVCTSCSLRRKFCVNTCGTLNCSSETCQHLRNQVRPSSMSSSNLARRSTVVASSSASARIASLYWPQLTWSWSYVCTMPLNSSRIWKRKHFVPVIHQSFTHFKHL